MDKNKLPQNIIELSNISDKEIPVEKWSGAVVFLLVENKLVLIKRSDLMPTHKGQIGLIGGHKNDDEVDPIETAKREFTEESNISADKITISGLILPVYTTKGKMIIPVLAHYVGSEEEFLRDVKSNGEWDDIVLAPMEFLENLYSWSWASMIGEKDYPIYFAPLLKSKCTYLRSDSDGSYLLWGATAKMVSNFFLKH